MSANSDVPSTDRHADPDAKPTTSGATTRNVVAG